MKGLTVDGGQLMDSSQILLLRGDLEVCFSVERGGRMVEGGVDG